MKAMFSLPFVAASLWLVVVVVNLIISQSVSAAEAPTRTERAEEQVSLVVGGFVVYPSLNALPVSHLALSLWWSL